MTQQNKFSGFPNECIAFLASLGENNNKTWFEAHRKEYEGYLLEPARGFVTAMGERMREIVPGIHADPRTNGSIFRIYRDTRFSKDKSPYKTHLAVFLWEGTGPKMECPGFYFHFDAEQLLLGAGVYFFPKALLHGYRQSVIHDTHGKDLAAILDDVRILYNGLHIGKTEPIPDLLFSHELINHCIDVFSILLPLHQWLVSLAQRTTHHDAHS